MPITVIPTPDSIAAGVFALKQRSLDMDMPEVETGTCDCCGEESPESALIDLSNCQDTVCETCQQDEYTYLSNHDEWFPNDEVVFLDSHDEFYHQDETFICDDCGEQAHEDDNNSAISSSHDSIYICDSCRDDSYILPEDDCQYYHIDALYYSERQDCYFANESLAYTSDGPLYSYSTDVLCQIDHIAYLDNNRFTGQFGKHLVFGVELETGTRGDDPRDIAKTLCNNTNFQEYGICKEDGSVSGPELVSLPATLRAHKETLNWTKWCEVLRPIAKGYYGNAGIHVHINKGAISSLTLGKMLVFCNSIENAELLSIVAQRDVTNTSWCELNSSKFDKVGKSAADPYNGKYSILNVTRNTVECRMFRSSLMPDRVYKNIEFCHALVKFCINTSARQLNSNYFQGYLTDNKHDYPYLYKFLNDRSEA